MRTELYTRGAEAGGSSPLDQPPGLPAWLLRRTFSSGLRLFLAPGQDGCKHRTARPWTSRSRGLEAPPPLRAGRGADTHLHAHEEGRQGLGRECAGSPPVPREVLPSLGKSSVLGYPDAGKGRAWPAGSPPVLGCPDAGEGACVVVWKSPPWPPGTRMRGKQAYVVVAESSRPGSRRGNRDCVVAAFLLLGAELSAVSGLAPPCAPEPSGQGGAAAAAEAPSGLLTLQLNGPGQSDCTNFPSHRAREGPLLSTSSPAAFACRLFHDGRS